MKALLTERVFAETIATHGGRVFRVGGCVRDQLMGIMPQDIDFCIVGMVKKNFKTLFPEAAECGKAFPVFRLPIDGAICEVAFARTERKVGSGHTGFKVSSNPKVTIEDDLFRRDTTVNSIAIDSLTKKLIDPFHGQEDIEKKILRATSPHFSEDPMRALRLAGHAARLGFAIEYETLLLAGTVALELTAEPTERVVVELFKVLTQAQTPATFFKVLAQAQLLEITFKELADLSIISFDSLMKQFDAVAKGTTSPKLRFSALGLGLAKEKLVAWNQRMTLPGEWLGAATTVGKITKLLEVPNPESIVEAVYALRRGVIDLEEFDTVAQAAESKVPLLSPFKVAMEVVQNNGITKNITGKAIGEYLRQKHIEIIGDCLR